MEAVREILLNMIVHRDYRASSDSTIKIHHDRIEFFNPGALLSGITIENILSGKNPSAPRNKQIASIFKEAGMIEKYGSGIKRVRQFMRDARAKEPFFESEAGFFKVTLFPMETMDEGVSEGVSLLHAYILNNPGERVPSLSISLGTSRKNIERWLKELR